ncbi:MAG TPA: aminotransferase class III-fold pyridoxal phosphate-dependent enzyme [Candidatus Cloacimonas acidaminovorans]|jgi:glutamate-1-semialdehyde aminotransferase|nr:aminotransferase class III-fold pyridoxal phosphate-dependent enzyme [Candidatus Cloacimonas sp.]HNZ89200.1 aminotransferase class III-fold pyridoxal phosphate-dependent enzyme [Candidatus Cloacimonas acidaminovorans]HPI43328.1 aminotransferase class III-fold pyridoxal phosphate-dependent enzyme [Candidatus Cloacimonas acidaminovorans]HPX58746.1 aminotransferase class III-fold pyridoxal phosphate-dependent enzyme [Candidatus Cloacimonas acidaminovorans]HQC09194.1 aminotransferase class III-f
MAEKLKLARSMSLFEEAKKLVPGGVAGIRRPYNFVPGEYPIFFDHGRGGRVVDVDGNEYIDFLCAYGPIIIGYREDEIDDAVINQIKNKGFCFSLTQEMQNTLVKKMRELIPCCEMAALVKTGSDATTIAIRVARGYTGKTKIARYGYHGWHDWCVEVKGGIPPKLYEDIYEFHYNDLDSLKAILEANKDDMAGIIITPIGHPNGAEVQMPKPGYLEAVRELANQYHCLLIFDEIRSGFRCSLGGAQKLFGVTPDLSTFGKAMANGYAIAALVGKEEYMQVLADKVFLSSTFFPNSDGIVAAIKTIEILERDRILDVVAAKGRKFGAEVEKVVEESGVPVNFTGAPWMPYITFKKDEAGLYKKLRTEYYTQLIRRNVFMQPYHHGYICYRHTDEDLAYTVEAIRESLAEVKKML